MDENTDNDRANRTLALAHALDLAGPNGWQERQVLKAAREFEAYLRGDKTEEPANG